jgi:hypothetical protein
MRDFFAADVGIFFFIIMIWETIEAAMNLISRVRKVQA